MRLYVAFPPRGISSRAVHCSYHPPSSSTRRRHNRSFKMRKLFLESLHEANGNIKNCEAQLFYIAPLAITALTQAHESTNAMATAAAGESIDRIRVKNGYGLNTSALSSSVIGRFDASSEKRQAINRSWEHRYSKDAEFQMAQLQDNHPVRKVLHMQKCYPETVRRLNNKNQRGGGQPSSTSSTTPPASSRWCRMDDARSTFESQQQQQQQPIKDVLVNRETRQRVAREYQFCRDKLVFNRTKGREAEVEGILTGKSPLEKHSPLFPARATHQQLLGLVHRPSFPNRPAPEVPKERKWLGDNVGWEGNRGLPTPQAGRNAKDGEVRPWPSSQFPSDPGKPAAASF